jgi:hypothetical protein
MTKIAEIFCKNFRENAKSVIFGAYCILLSRAHFVSSIYKIVFKNTYLSKHYSVLCPIPQVVRILRWTLLLQKVMVTSRGLHRSSFLKSFRFFVTTILLKVIVCNDRYPLCNGNDVMIKRIGAG